MKELVFLLEEASAKALLESLLPRFLNTEISPRYIVFEGKQDLEKQLARKIRVYQNNQARFIIVRDQDSHPECKQIKQELLDLCRDSGKHDKCLVRIACKELETFYLADLLAVENALNIKKLSEKQRSKKFRNPDRLGSPSHELKKLTDGKYQKISGSRAIGTFLDLDNRCSPSFYNFILAIRRMEQELLGFCLN